MTYFIILLTITAYLAIPRYYKFKSSEEQRFVNMALLVVLIWSIQSLLTPEECHCKIDYLGLASLSALAIVFVLDKLNRRFGSNL